MVNHHAALDSVFGALADPTRRAILDRLTKGEATISELAAPFPMSLPAIGKHLDVLERARLVVRRREGRVRRVSLVARPLGGATAWLDRYRRFWEDQFDRLAEHLGETPTPSMEHQSWPPRPATPPARSASSAGSPPRRNASTPRGRRRKK